MPRPLIAARVSSTKPASFRVSECRFACTPEASATLRHASMAAGVVPQSSCNLKPAAPARNCSHMASALTVLPLPSRATLSGQWSSASSMRARCQAPGVTVVALLPSAGPVPPATMVVMPPPSASSMICGQIRCTWQSIATADGGLDDSPVIDDDDPGDHRIRRPVGTRGTRLAHRLAKHLASAEDGLVARQAGAAAAVLGDLDEEFGVG